LRERGAYLEMMARDWVKPSAPSGNSNALHK
jgi:hypothetical protein